MLQNTCNFFVLLMKKGTFSDNVPANLSQQRSTLCRGGSCRGGATMREQRDEWRPREREAGSPLQCQPSSRMSLISPPGKVRLRLRSASLTAICHFTFHTRSLLPSLLFAALGPAQFQPGLVRDGREEGDGRRRVGERSWNAGRAGSGGGRRVVRGQPMGLLSSGALLLCLGLSWQEKR